MSKEENPEKRKKRLLNLLKPVAADYDGLGVQLCISHDKLRELEGQYGGQKVKVYLSRVLSWWLNQGDRDLDTLVEGLKQIDRKVLATKLESDYKGKSSEKLYFYQVMNAPQ